MDHQEANAKGTLRHPVGYSYPTKLYRSKSKDKLPNGKMAMAAHSKCKINSRVPKVVRNPANLCNAKASTDKITEKLDNSGDNRTSNGRTIQFLAKRDLERSRPSYIPRRKTVLKEDPTIEKPSSTIPKRKTPQVYIERNVQRVQMLINQDYRPAEHGRMESVARPIPDLGHIYGRTTEMESANISDWFVTLNAPANSLASNIINLNSRQTTNGRNIMTNDGKCKMPDTSECNGLESCTPQTYSIPTVDKTSDWTMSDVEYPTRDNESGYRSLSPTRLATRTPPRDVVQSSSDLKETTSEKIDRLIRRATAHTEETPEKDSTITQQSTVVLAKITSSMLLKERSNKTESKEDINTESKKSHNSVSVVIYKPNQETVPSYVECPSEILQKTTNFEMDCNAGTPNSMSSITGTDLEIRDDMSSQCTLDPDDCSICDQSAIEWCNKCGKPQVAQSKKELFSETTSVTESMLTHLNDDLSETDAFNNKDSVYELKPFDDIHYCCWKKHNTIYRSYCEKCQKYRRFPSCRFREINTLSSIRRRISIRICRRRLSRVWKKTTEKWAMWSAKPPQRFRKHRMMKYLQRTVISEDAHAQTNVFVFRENGTNSVPKERKSRSITAVLNWDSCFSYKSESGTAATVSPFSKTKVRNCNIGPSMFPFLYNSERNALLKQNIQACTVIPNVKKDNKNDVNNEKETKKSGNTIFLQTSDSLMEKTLGKTTELEIDEQSDDTIRICEVSVDDKDTGTEDIPSQMKEEVTSTLLHIDAIRILTMPTQNIATQMWLACNDAETYISYPSGIVGDSRNVSVSTVNSKDFTFATPCGINTEPKELGSINVMTSSNILKSFNSIGTETERESLDMKSLPAGIATCTSNHMFTNPLDKSQMMFIPITPMRTIAVTTSKKELMDTGLMVLSPKLNSGVCLTSPIQICQCPILAPCVSCGTDTNDITTNSSNSATKLKTYVNTGMLLNTIVEQAVLRGSPKFSVFTETKSIGNKYTSDIGICTNTILTDSVIETEKGPRNLSANTNTFMNQESKFTEQNSSFATEDAKRLENATQYSRDARKDAEAALRLCEGIGQSYLMSVRTLSRSVEEVEAQTEIAFPENGFLEIVGHKKCTSSVSTSCALDETPKTIPAIDNKEKTEVETNTEQKSDMIMLNEKKSNSNVDASRQMNEAVLSSALNAVKWIKAGFQVEMERTANNSNFIKKSAKSFDTTSKDPEKAGKINGLQTNNVKVVTQDTVDYAFHNESTPPMKTASSSKCVDGKSDSKLASSIVRNIEGSDDSTDANTADDSNAIPFQLQEKQLKPPMIDEVTSDVLVKDVKEITLQASPDSCDAVPPSGKTDSKFSVILKLDSSLKTTECARENERKSASALTSRCILPGLPYYYCENHRCGELSGDCRFVYDLPRCIVHTRKLEYKAIKKEPDPVKVDPYVSIHKTQCNKSVGTVATGTPEFESKWSLDGPDNISDDIPSHQEVIHEDNGMKSVGVMKCCCLSRPNMNKQSFNTTDDSISTIRNSVDPLSRLITLSTCCDTKPHEKQTRPANIKPEEPMFEKNNISQQLDRMVDFTPSCNQSKPSTDECQQNSKENVVSASTSTNEESFSRTVGLVTSRQNKPTFHKQTSYVIGQASNATSVNVQDVKQSVGFNTSRCELPTCQKHTSNMYQTMSAQTSVKEPLDKTIGLITSRQNSPPIHNKKCSNITKYATATTSMYDEMNTQSIGVINSSYQKEYTLASLVHPEEQCLQSVGIITSAWKGTPVVRTIDVAFLMSPKEYEALYKTTRLLTKEAAKAAIQAKKNLAHPNRSRPWTPTQKKTNASVNAQDVKQSVGLNTFRCEPPTCQEHTSNMYQTMSAQTSVKEPLDKTIGLITSRQNSPPIHNKKCSNITKCDTATTSMYDEINTQSIGVINSSYQKEYTSAYSLVIHKKNTLARRAVEVHLRAEVQSAQNMTTPSMQSETVMAAPSQNSAYTIDVTPPDTSPLRVIGTSANTGHVTRVELLGPSVSNAYDPQVSVPSCSDRYPLLNLEIPTRDSDIGDDSVNMKTHLAASCRYYSNLLTKHLDSVKENLTKHLTGPSENPDYLPMFSEACTMKPSAREEFGCQTFKDLTKEKLGILDPSVNETDICRHDKEHLQSVYYMLSAIEGRLRRLKSSVDSYTK